MMYYDNLKPNMDAFNNKPSTQATRRPSTDATQTTGKIHPFSKTFELKLRFDVLQDLECTKPM